MKEEIETLWPLSESYEYAAELGLVLRGALPGEWATWDNPYALPQASGFAFYKHLEMKDPDLLRSLLPDIISNSPQSMQEEWRASLRPPLRQEKSEELPPAPGNVSLWAPNTSSNERAKELWSWTLEAFPEKTLRKSEAADPLLLSRVHSGEYLDGLREASDSGGARLTPETEVPPGSWESMLAVSGAAVDAALFAWHNRSKEFLFALPGSHHAGRNRARGTCLLHHIGIAAERLRREPGVNRLVILDIDAHHGNGSEEIFFDREDVVTVSLHQKNPFFPGTGSSEMRGSGRGRGCNINLTLNPEDSWIHVVEEAVELVRSFAPDMLLVQFGGDAHWKDEASDLGATFDDFRQAGKKVSSLELPMLVELGAATNSFSWVGSLRSFACGLF